MKKGNRIGSLFLLIAIKIQRKLIIVHPLHIGFEHQH